MSDEEPLFCATALHWARAWGQDLYPTMDDYVGQPLGNEKVVYVLLREAYVGSVWGKILTLTTRYISHDRTPDTLFSNSSRIGLCQERLKSEYFPTSDLDRLTETGINFLPAFLNV